MVTVAGAAIVGLSPVANAATTTSPTPAEPGNTARISSTDNLLSGLGLGGIADTVADLLHGLLGSAKGIDDGSGLGLPELP
ncbi:MAG TPA: hypothetical protein VM677_23540 [Actinokineospora sp.]|jgi:hypothetical protein|nr:hypothetical protein [Actinokineospora sp.]